MHICREKRQANGLKVIWAFISCAWIWPYYFRNRIWHKNITIKQYQYFTKNVNIPISRLFESKYINRKWLMLYNNVRFWIRFNCFCFRPDPEQRVRDLVGREQPSGHHGREDRQPRGKAQHGPNFTRRSAGSAVQVIAFQIIYVWVRLV